MKKKHIIFLANKVDLKDSEVDSFFLFQLLNTESVKEREHCHEKFMASFALNRAKSRLELTKKHNKKTFGLEKLISALSLLEHNKYIDFYNISNNEYTGTIFVFNEKIIGYEFVCITGIITKAGLDENLLG